MPGQNVPYSTETPKTPTELMWGFLILPSLFDVGQMLRLESATPEGHAEDPCLVSLVLYIF